jgi:DNA-binding NarL/FixJ family response regulator
LSRFENPAGERHDRFERRHLAGLDTLDEVLGGATMRTIHVLIVDDQPVVRAGLHALLEAEDDMSVVGIAFDGDDAVALAHELQPDVVLLDAAVCGLDVLEVTRRITEQDTGVRIMILAAHDSDDCLFAALRAGAGGFVVKDSDAADLLGAVRIVATGAALSSPRATERLIATLASQPQPHVPTEAQLCTLTPREREVIALVAIGLSNDEIADRLVISRATAKTHVSRALSKLDVRDRAQLVAVAYQAGIVHPGDPAALRSGAPLRPATVHA